MNREAFQSIAQAFETADHAWHAELVRLFGDAAGTVRYTRFAQGEAGTTLRALYEARSAASDAWTNAKQFA